MLELESKTKFIIVHINNRLIEKGEHNEKSNPVK